MWDLGHRENLLFLKMAWGARGAFVGEMRLTGDEVGFWKRTGMKRRGVEPLWVSDSHRFAHSLTAGVGRVVLFDAHHDCWEGDKGFVSCENWLRAWLEGSKRRRAVWVRPGWLEKGACEVPEDLRDRVDVVEGLEGLEGLDLGLEGPVTTHVCRSGCWMPPWLDKAFLGFLEGWGGGLEGVLDMQEGEWKALEPRWAEKDLERALEEARRMGEFAEVCRKKEHTIVGMPSGDFARGMVEVRF
jgi:hypothetical protein